MPETGSSVCLRSSMSPRGVQCCEGRARRGHRDRGQNERPHAECTTCVGPDKQIFENRVLRALQERFLADREAFATFCEGCTCPGNEESAGVNYSHRCPKGNRQMRRVLNQAANAAVKAKGTIFAIVYRRLVPRLGHAQAIGAITHRLCRLTWKILHQRVRYEERGPAVSEEAKKVRARKMIRELRTLGYQMELRHLRHFVGVTKGSISGEPPRVSMSLSRPSRGRLGISRRNSDSRCSTDCLEGSD